MTFERWRDPPVSIDGGQPLSVVVAKVAAIVPGAIGAP